MKKHICIFLMFCMVWGMLPLGSMAEESGESLQSVVGVDSTTEVVYMATGTPPPSSGGSGGGGGGYTTSVPAPTPTPTPTFIPTSTPPSTGGSGGGGGGGVIIIPTIVPNPTSPPSSGGGGGGGGGTNRLVLAFQPADSVSNADGSVLYLSSRTEKKVYAIDTLTFEQKTISFTLMPESMYFKDGLLYVSLCAQDHSSYWWEEDQTGAFAVIEAASFTLQGQFDINTDPYDIVVSKDNYIYIASGSGQWTDIYCFAQDGTVISRGSIREASTIKYNSVLNKIYTITSDVSPRNMTAYSLGSDGKFLEEYGWSYHGDFSSSTSFAVSPDGKYIFNTYGYILNCSADKSKDMKKWGDINKIFNDICFDLASNTYYMSSSDKYITAFEYEDFRPTLGYTATTGNPKRIFLRDDSIIALTLAANNVYCIELIHKSTATPPNTDNNYVVSFVSKIKNAVYSSLTNKAYAIDKGAKELMVFDHQTGQMEQSIALECLPDDICISADGSKLLIANDSYAYMATVLDSNTLQEIGKIPYSAPANTSNYVELAHRKITEGAGKIFIADGSWEPKMYVFDSQTYQYLGTYGILNGIGGMAIDSTQQHLYTWYQYGWGAGYAGSRLYKYDITGAAALLVDQYEPTNYTDLERDPLDSPILFTNDDKLILKKKTFGVFDLKTNNNTYPNPIYAINQQAGYAVGLNGIYDINTGTLIESINLSGSASVYFDRDGKLYYAKGGEIKRYYYGSPEAKVGTMSYTIGSDTHPIAIQSGVTEYKVFVPNDSIPLLSVTPLSSKATVSQIIQPTQLPCNVTFSICSENTLNTMTYTVRFLSEPIDPVVTWPQISEITYGQAFGEAISDGEGDGVFTVEDADIVPNASSTPYTKTITFTPADTDTYKTLTKQVEITVNKAWYPMFSISETAIVTHNSITLKPIPGAQYKIGTENGASWGEWGSNNVFTGLSPNTTYVVVYSIPESENYMSLTHGADITTLSEPPQPMPPIISVSATTVQRGTDTTVAISIQPNSGMATGSLVLDYDSDFLSADTYIVDGAIKDASPMVNLRYINPVTGKKAVKLSWMGLSPLNAGGDLIRVRFHLSSNAVDGAVLPLTLSDIILVNADAEPVEYVIKKGSITVCDYVLGDANGDQVVNILDAFSILRYDAGLVPYTDRQKSAADVNKDGAVDIYDAMLIQRYDLGLGGWVD